VLVEPGKILDKVINTKLAGIGGGFNSFLAKELYKVLQSFFVRERRSFTEREFINTRFDSRFNVHSYTHSFLIDFLGLYHMFAVRKIIATKQKVTTYAL
jgi:hypothetical protein